MSMEERNLDTLTTVDGDLDEECGPQPIGKLEVSKFDSKIYKIL